MIDFRAVFVRPTMNLSVAHRHSSGGLWDETRGVGAMD